MERGRNGVLGSSIEAKSMKGKYSDIYAMMHALGSPLGDEELKETLVESISGGRTKSLRALSATELSALRERLRRQTGSKPSSGNKSRKRNRSIVLGLLTDYGIDTQDWDAVNAFCCDTRIAGKPFASLTDEELEALRGKLYAILRKKSAPHLRPTSSPCPSQAGIREQAALEQALKYYNIKILN